MLFTHLYDQYDQEDSRLNHPCGTLLSFLFGYGHAVALRIRSLLRLLALLFTLWFALLTNSQPAKAQEPRPSSTGAMAPASTPMHGQEIKASLQRILNGAEYQPETKEQSFVTKWIKKGQKAWEDLKKWFRDLFHIGAMQGGGSLLTYVLVTLLLGALFWTTYRLFREWSPRGSANRNRRRLIAAEEEEMADIIRDPVAWLTQAEEWVRKEDYRRAFRAVFLAILLRLDAANVLSYDRARTNGDYLRLLRVPHAQSLHALLVPLAQAFDARWYGDVPTTPEDYQSILATYHRLPEVLPASPPLASASTSTLQPLAGKA